MVPLCRSVWPPSFSHCLVPFNGITLNTHSREAGPQVHTRHGHSTTPLRQPPALLPAKRRLVVTHPPLRPLNGGIMVQAGTVLIRCIHSLCPPWSPYSAWFLGANCSSWKSFSHVLANSGLNQTTLLLACTCRVFGMPCMHPAGWGTPNSCYPIPNVTPAAAASSLPLPLSLSLCLSRLVRTSVSVSFSFH